MHACGEPEKSRPLIERLKEDARMMGKSYFLAQVAALEAYADLTCGQIKPALSVGVEYTAREKS